MICPELGGNILVVSTGLDCVLKVDESGSVLSEWAVAPESVRKTFPQGAEYRRLATTKPHATHPNYIGHDGEDWWVSRSIQHDVACLTDQRRTVSFHNSPHDGVLFDGLAYFTTVDGHIYIVDLRNAVIKDCIDLNAIAASKCNLG